MTFEKGKVKLEALAKFAISLNIYSCLVYAIPLKNLLSGLPNITLTTLANILLVILFLIIRVKRKYYVFLFLLTSYVLLVAIYNIKSVNVAYESNIIRGILVITCFVALVDRFRIKKYIEDVFVNVSKLASCLVVLQLISVFFLGDVFFGIEYSTFLRASEGNIMFRVSPLNGDPNYFAYVMMPGVALLMMRILIKKFEMKTLLWFAFVFVCFLLTMSRGTIIAIVLGGGYLIISNLVNNKKTFRAIIILIITVSLIPMAYNYISEARSTNANSSSQQRLEIIKAQLNKIDDSVFFGNSISDSKVLVDGLKMGPHNLYIEVLSSYGIIAFTIFSILLVYCFYRRDKIEVLSTLVFMIGSVFLGLLIYQPFWMVFAFCISRGYENKDEYVKNNYFSLGN
ncbi:O-antigen ligase family protein [Vibrio parahaemolyticus]|uniref:O-antigen ligase family protein n=1 Tax=Vibrio parahaemolyticus TaxID=670 RepID=UPI000543C528|nr:O-antigen ligase family protein [Vibrio parahaemolyticus]EIE1195890.1 O-antigen ligase family protein [Vibrio parahaemolyticus]EIU6754635.1 O-antigen ligase family protein [Vibrio parahaemolyticus]EJC6987079.1 O-antigen ligase family protein [Vibrio parahaemolyticus]EJG1900897.1 O-antigen ligase family protein [Vibrio parahaemolyticus]ELA9193825.1 O-antigen ligase family protein [Vibrio parahaemolyticus]